VHLIFAVKCTVSMMWFWIYKKNTVLVISKLREALSQTKVSCCCRRTYSLWYAIATQVEVIYSV